MNSKVAQKVSKALSDPNRLRIIEELKKKKDTLYCCDLDDVLNLSQPSVCHHLKILTDTEILISEKEGKFVKYVLNKELLDSYIRFIKSLTT